MEISTSSLAGLVQIAPCNPVSPVHNKAIHCTQNERPVMFLTMNDLLMRMTRERRKAIDRRVTKILRDMKAASPNRRHVLISATMAASPSHGTPDGQQAETDNLVFAYLWQHLTIDELHMEMLTVPHSQLVHILALKNKLTRNPQWASACRLRPSEARISRFLDFIRTDTAHQQRNVRLLAQPHRRPHYVRDTIQFGLRKHVQIQPASASTPTANFSSGQPVSEQLGK